MRFSRLLIGLTSASALGAAVAISACSTEPLKAPTSDSNFDDPDEPPNTGIIGAVDATTAESSADVSIPCTTTGECPSTFTCYFPVSQGCAVTAGTCIVYLQSAGCTAKTRCGCGGSAPLRECSPEGYASAPVSSDGPCDDAATPVDAADAASE